MCCSDNLAPEHSPPMSTPRGLGQHPGGMGRQAVASCPTSATGHFEGWQGQPPHHHHLSHLSCDILVLARDPSLLALRTGENTKVRTLPSGRYPYLPPGISLAHLSSVPSLCFSVSAPYGPALCALYYTDSSAQLCWGVGGLPHVTDEQAEAESGGALLTPRLELAAPLPSAPPDLHTH